MFFQSLLNKLKPQTAEQKLRLLKFFLAGSSALSAITEGLFIYNLTTNIITTRRANAALEKEEVNSLIDAANQARFNYLANIIGIAEDKISNACSYIIPTDDTIESSPVDSFIASVGCSGEITCDGIILNESLPSSIIGNDSYCINGNPHSQSTLYLEAALSPIVEEYRANLISNSAAIIPWSILTPAFFMLSIAGLGLYYKKLIIPYTYEVYDTKIQEFREELKNHIEILTAGDMDTEAMSQLYALSYQRQQYLNQCLKEQQPIDSRQLKIEFHLPFTITNTLIIQEITQHNELILTLLSQREKEWLNPPILAQKQLYQEQVSASIHYLKGNSALPFTKAECSKEMIKRWNQSQNIEILQEIELLETDAQNTLDALITQPEQQEETIAILLSYRVLARELKDTLEKSHQETDINAPHKLNFLQERHLTATLKEYDAQNLGRSQAATRIQAVWRGFQTRQKLHDNKQEILLKKEILAFKEVLEQHETLLPHLNKKDTNKTITLIREIKEKAQQQLSTSKNNAPLVENDYGLEMEEIEVPLIRKSGYTRMIAKEKKDSVSINIR